MKEPAMYQSGSNNLQAGRDINVEKMIFAMGGLANKPTKIARVIAQLAKEVTAEIPDEYSAVNFYDIQDKINHNKVIRYKPIIDRYGFFGALVESICDKLDTDKPNSKSRMFEFIKYQYVTVKSRICGEAPKENCLSIIQDNADNIIDDINNSLLELVIDSKDLEDVDQEDIKISLAILIAVAFINCTILEKPPETK